MIGVHETDATLQPDIEEVAEIDIGGVTVIGWVGDNSIKGLITKWQLQSRGTFDMSGSPALHKLLDYFSNPVQCMRWAAWSLGAGIDLGKVPGHRKRRACVCLAAC